MRLLVRAVFGALLVLAGSSGLVNAQDIDQRYRLLMMDGHPVKWGKPDFGAGVTVSYRLVRQSRTLSDARNCRNLVSVDGLLARSELARTDFLDALGEAFAMWEAAAAIRFVAATDDDADILIGAQDRPAGIAFADVLPDVGVDGDIRPLRRGLVCLNPHRIWTVRSDDDGRGAFDLRLTLAHEIGHAIGLDHPGPRGTLMSFIYNAERDGLQPGDIVGAVSLYGPPARLLSDARATTRTTVSN